MITVAYVKGLANKLVYSKNCALDISFLGRSNSFFSQLLLHAINIAGIWVTITAMEDWGLYLN